RVAVPQRGRRQGSENRSKKRQHARNEDHDRMGEKQENRTHARYLADEIDNDGNQRHRERRREKRQRDDAALEKTDETVDQRVSEGARRYGARAVEQQDAGGGDAGAGDRGVDRPADKQHHPPERAAGGGEIEAEQQ